MILALVSLIAIGVAGTLGVGLLLGRPGADRSLLGLQVVLGLGVGMGLASCLLFLIGLALDGLSPTACLVETALVGLVGGVLLFAARRSRREPTASLSEPRSQSGFAWFLAVCCSLAFIFAVVEVSRYAAWRRHGHWDAWAIWNLRARFLARADHDWPRAFQSGFASTHPDYPLLVPLTVARYWTCIGNESTLVPRLVSMAFGFGGAALLVASLAVLRGWSNALLAGLVLLSGRFFLAMGAWQIADGPLAYYVLAACALLVLKNRTSDDGHSIDVLIGLVAGLAAWTKNEGLLVALLILVVPAVVTTAMRGARVALRGGMYVAAGMVPVVVVLLFFKLAYAPTNDLLAALGRETFEKLTDASRHAEVAVAFRLNFHLIAGSLVWMLPVYGVASGFGVKGNPARGAISAALVLVLLLAGYYLVFVTTPRDLTWHLETACLRTLYHAWPALVFVFFLLVASPEEIVAHKTGVMGRILAAVTVERKLPCSSRTAG